MHSEPTAVTTASGTLATTAVNAVAGSDNVASGNTDAAETSACSTSCWSKCRKAQSGKQHDEKQQLQKPFADAIVRCGALLRANLHMEGPTVLRRVTDHRCTETDEPR